MLVGDLDELVPGGPRRAASPLEGARGKLEQSLWALRSVRHPGVPRERARAALQRAMQSCYEALASRHDHEAYHAARDAAVVGTREVLSVLQEGPLADEGGQRALGLAAAALGLLLGADTTPLGGGADWPRARAGGTVRRGASATVGVPAIVELERPLLVPVLPLPAWEEEPPPPEKDPPPPPPLTTLAEVEALGAAAFARLGLGDDTDDDESGEEGEAEPAARATAPAADEPPETIKAAHEAVVYGSGALSELALRLKRAENFLDELAGLGNMRRAGEREPWPAPRTEQRLLARVDALVACGEAAWPSLVGWLEERPLPDPELTWAVLFFFGSLRGTDAVDQVERLVLASDLEVPDMAPLVADALALAPHPGLAEPLRRWLRAPAPALRAVALEARGHRRELTWEEAVTGASDSRDEVVLAATKQMGTALGSPVLPVLSRLVQSPDPAICRAAHASFCRLGHRAAFTAASEALLRALSAHAAGVSLDGPDFTAHGDVPLFWALGAGAEAWATVKDILPAEPSAIFVEALGWLGHLEAVPYLVKVLDASASDEAREAAPWALYRLTGAPLSDDDGPDAWSRAGDDGRWPMTFSAPDRPGVLTKDPELWDAWWQTHRAGAPAGVRYRFGHAWSPADNLWELESPETQVREREPAHLELVLRVGASAQPLERRAFVAQQKQELAALRAHCDRSGVRPGEYSQRFAR